jgi:hypothetical protein
MKRVGNVYGELRSISNIEKAAEKAKKGKSRRKEVAAYYKNKDNLNHKLSLMLSEHKYKVSKSVVFEKVTRNGKVRKINKVDRSELPLTGVVILQDRGYYFEGTI